MGKGDSRSRRGKIYKGSFGKTRPKDPERAKKDTVKKDPVKIDLIKKVVPKKK